MPALKKYPDEMRAEGFAVESICRVLREQGCLNRTGFSGGCLLPGRLTSAWCL